MLLSCCEEGQTVTFLYVLSRELADYLWPVYVDIQVILRCSFPDRSEAEVNDCCFRGHSGWARCPFLNCWGSNLVMWLMFWSTAFTTMFWCLFLMVFGFWILGCFYVEVSFTVLVVLLSSAILSVLLVLWSQLSLTIKLMLLKFLPMMTIKTKIL